MLEQLSVAERFHHSKLPGWSNLSESERYHTGMLARILDDCGWVTEWRYGRTTIAFTGHLEDPKDRYSAWLCESLLVALTNPEKRIAFRAFVQATEYAAKVGPSIRFSDSYAAAQLRVEKMLGLS